MDIHMLWRISNYEPPIEALNYVAWESMEDAKLAWGIATAEKLEALRRDYSP